MSSNYKLLKKRKNVTISSWGNSFCTRGDNNRYIIYVPGILMDGTPKCSSAAFQLVGINSNNNTIAKQDITELESVYNIVNGIAFSFLYKSGMNMINFGIAVPTKDIIVTV